MSQGAGAPTPRRVRVTSPRREAHRRAERRPGYVDLTEQTGLGEVYFTALLRAQLRLALRVLLAMAILVGWLPALFLLVPAASAATLGPLPVPWLVVGALLYPVVVLAAAVHVRGAERIERDFVDLLRRR